MTSLPIEADVLGQVDDWLAEMFAPNRDRAERGVGRS
jgi:hypothetical protein